MSWLQKLFQHLLQQLTVSAEQSDVFKESFIISIIFRQDPNIVEKRILSQEQIDLVCDLYQRLSKLSNDYQLAEFYSTASDKMTNYKGLGF